MAGRRQPRTEWHPFVQRPRNLLPVRGFVLPARSPTLMPEWLVGLVLQIPLVAAVLYAFLRGLVHSHAELERREAEHQAELVRRSTTLETRIEEWRTLYAQERADRIAADARLAAAVAEIKDAAARVDDLTKEVIRHGPRNA